MFDREEAAAESERKDAAASLYAPARRDAAP